ncbi:type VI secretion system tip protein VgrG [Luteimonas sp. BDR2-5]|uniref:type VI secretion system Vgr family protein n=1 Tax=Proluteimonas luteida TaxID=2878685 RepID=UPI001E507DA3|nr:type VI secretion system tip protein TssI/VgrG [Luteimonas sp. BDR2-5]MCD9027909.1 type VI secretion system tip protein VgrG [Luteimonas sp. BDR2-5]
MSYSTSHRLFLLSTPLGEDVLLIREFEGHEAISRAFEFRLLVVSERDDIEARELIGKRVSLRIETDTGERHWAGMVRAFERIGEHHDPGAEDAALTAYRCVVVPAWWTMTLHEDSRIFQNESVPAIVDTILGEFGLSDYEMHVGHYPDLLYCTQYRETNFDFISRLLERAGIRYFVKYSGEVETLVFTDSNDEHPRLDDDRIRFATARLAGDEDTVTSLSRRQALGSGRFVARDYNFLRPGDLLETSVASLVDIGDNGNYERFVYPGGYLETSDGEAIAKTRMEAEEAEHEIVDGTSTVRTLVPGYRFTLEDHPHDELNREYLLLSVEHRGSNNVGRDGAVSSYANRFTAIPKDVVYRDHARTPRPMVHGPQSALVVGPPGEEIHTDEHGRIKVHFFWDRRSRSDDKSSCWIRVAHSHAGAGWGTFTLPRIGEEVLVAFEHGDPDRPLVIGSVYNGRNKPPYALPEHQTRSTLKSNSSKGGGGFNELRFEDRAGNEEVFLHAQKDLQTRVGNDRTTSVAQQQQLTVGGDRLEHIGNEDHRVVDGRSLSRVAREAHVDVGASALFAAGQNLHMSVGMETSLDAGTEVHVKGGMNIVLEAGVQISLKAGGSSITLGPAGVTLDGALVRVNCGGAPLSAKKGDKPDQAKTAEEAVEDKAGKVSNTDQQVQAEALRNAAKQAQPFCAACEGARQALMAMR